MLGEILLLTYTYTGLILLMFIMERNQDNWPGLTTENIGEHQGNVRLGLAWDFRYFCSHTFINELFSGGSRK